MGAHLRPAAILPAQTVIDWELTLLLGGLGLLIFVGLTAVIELRRRARDDEDDTELLMPQSLEHYQDLRDRGLLDPQEFERIRVLLERGAARPPDPPTATP